MFPSFSKKNQRPFGIPNIHWVILMAAGIAIANDSNAQTSRVSVNSQPLVTASPSVSPSISPSPSTMPSASPTVTAEPSQSPSPTSTPTFSVSPTPSASATVSPTPSASPSVTASAFPSPSPVPAPQRAVYQSFINPGNDSGVSGFATFVVESNSLGVYLQVADLDPGINHLQHIHAYSQCPSPGVADTNQDGLIDIVEAQAVAGPPVLPLTNDLFQSSPNRNNIPVQNYPMPSNDGSLTYVNTIPLNKAISALKSAPPSPTPSGSPSATPTPSSSTTPVSAGTFNSPIALENYTIEIHGISTNFTLPSTVQTAMGLTPNQSLPVACGTIERVQE